MDSFLGQRRPGGSPGIEGHEPRGILPGAGDDEARSVRSEEHNEHSPANFEGPGYSEIGALLEDNNYLVRTLNLVVTGTVPSDASVVVVAGPETQLLQEEQDRLTSYLLMGGKALILHGRGDMKKACSQINGGTGIRVYIPDIGLFRRKDWKHVKS